MNGGRGTFVSCFVLMCCSALEGIGHNGLRADVQRAYNIDKGTVHG